MTHAEPQEHPNPGKETLQGNPMDAQSMASPGAVEVPEAMPTLDAPSASASALTELDAGGGSKAAGQGMVLRNISEIRHFFRTNRSPVFFLGASAFNLLGLDRWMRGFSYIVYYDSWLGTHPRVFSPVHKPYIEFESGKEINNWLLQHHEVRSHIAQCTPAGTRPRIAMVFFNEETEAICDELGYDLILPSAALRTRLDSKLVITRIGEAAGVHSVPNTIATVDSWDELCATAEAANLGNDWVIQTAYGDSGRTTFFVNDEPSYQKIAGEIADNEVKIMKRINHRPVAVEAVITRHGTIVGPFMTEITGFSELTPYRGGWAGNEMFATVLSETERHAAIRLVRTLGDQLSKEGYRGFFEVDLLLDTDSGEVYLGELNPRISGASAITNVTAGAYADIPLFLFHLLEYSDVDFELDVDALNERWERLAADDLWSQMIIRHTAPTVEQIHVAPPTGRYILDQRGRLVFSHGDLDWQLLSSESEAFYMRIYGAGDYLWQGADLGILVTKGRLLTTAGALSIRAKHLIDSMRAMYSTTQLPAPQNGGG